MPQPCSPLADPAAEEENLSKIRANLTEKLNKIKMRTCKRNKNTQFIWQQYHHRANLRRSQQRKKKRRAKRKS